MESNKKIHPFSYQVKLFALSDCLKCNASFWIEFVKSESNLLSFTKSFLMLRAWFILPNTFWNQHVHMSHENCFQSHQSTFTQNTCTEKWLHYLFVAKNQFWCCVFFIKNIDGWARSKLLQNILTHHWRFAETCWDICEMTTMKCFEFNYHRYLR